MQLSIFDPKLQVPPSATLPVRRVFPLEQESSSQLLLNADNYEGQFRFRTREDEFWARHHQKDDFNSRETEQAFVGLRKFRIQESEAAVRVYRETHRCGIYGGITGDALTWIYGHTVSHLSGVGWFCSQAAFQDQPMLGAELGETPVLNRS